jgi:hypothetical protein
MDISAVIVTRGDVDLGPVLSSIDADEVIIRRGHDGIWERWEAAQSAKHHVIYTQDDDAVVDFPAVIQEYDPERVTCNMPLDRRPGYPDAIALVGWGCVFDRPALEAFTRYRKYFPNDHLFRREADRVFTGLNRLKLIEIPFEHLPIAFERQRMGAQPEHGACLHAIRQRIYHVRQHD